jgi:hypothetical protein
MSTRSAKARQAVSPPRIPAQGSWAKIYDAGGGGEAADVRQTPEGGFLAAGWTKAFVGASTDMWVVRLDTSGDILWQRSYGGAGRDEIEKLHPTPDGGYIGIGLGSSFRASQHAPLVLKFDANGSVQWRSQSNSGPRHESHRHCTPSLHMTIGKSCAPNVYRHSKSLPKSLFSS